MQSIGLRPRQFALLNAIALAGGASQQEVGRRLGLDPSGLGGAIDELERAGLVERRRAQADRRRYVLGLTDEGSATLTRLSSPGVSSHELLYGTAARAAVGLSEFLSRWAVEDFVYVDIVGLADGERHALREGIRRYCRLLIIAFKARGDIRLCDAFRQLSLHRARGDHRYADVVCFHVLAQSFG